VHSKDRKGCINVVPDLPLIDKTVPKGDNEARDTTNGVGFDPPLML